MPQIYDMGPTLYIPPKEGVLRILSPLKIRRLRHATPRPPKPLHFNKRELRDALGKADQPVAKGSLSFPDQLQRKTYFFPKRRFCNKVRDCTYFLQIGHPACAAEGSSLSFNTGGRQTNI